MKRRHFARAALGAWAAGATLLARAADTVAFFRAVRQDNASAIRDLLRAGMDPNAVDEHGAPALYVALQEDCLEAALALIAARGIDVNRLNATGENALMMAALKKQTAIVTQLLRAGAAVNKTGWTPLHYAATSGDTPIMQTLLDHGAAIDAASPNGTSPLMMAARYGSADAVRLLLRSGARVELRNQQGLTALEFAQQGERSDAVALITAALRAQGADGGPRGQW